MASKKFKANLASKRLIVTNIFGNDGKVVTDKDNHPWVRLMTRDHKWAKNAVCNFGSTATA